MQSVYLLYFKVDGKGKKIAEDWIRTADLCCRKQLLYQLSPFSCITVNYYLSENYVPFQEMDPDLSLTLITSTNHLVKLLLNIYEFVTSVEVLN